MKYVIHRSLYGDELGDIVTQKTEIRDATEVIKVSLIAGDQVVDRHDLVALFQKTVGQMRAQKASSTGHHATGHPSGLGSFRPQGKPSAGARLPYASESLHEWHRRHGHRFFWKLPAGA